MPVRSEQSDQTKEILEGIEIALGRERLREAGAAADEAENRARNRDLIERVEAEAAEKTGRLSRDENRRRWIWLIAAVLLGGAAFLRGSPVQPLLMPAIDGAASTRSVDGDTPPGSGSTMTTKPPAGEGEHPSSSSVQGTVERAMVKWLGTDLGIPLAKKQVDYEDGAYFEIDGVDPERSVFVEAFARIGTLKAGQKKKVGTDTLKFLALRDRHPDAKFILAFVDEAAAGSVVRWQQVVQERHGIQRILVPLPTKLRAELVAAQAEQKNGMESASFDQEAGP